VSKTDRATKLAGEIRAYCQEHANPKLAEKYARYFKEGYDAWGLMDSKNPVWNQQKDLWFEQYSALGLPVFLKLGETLFASGKYEEGAVAIHFVKRFRDNLSTESLEGLARWFDGGIRNWAHTDVLCGEILAPLLQSGQLPLHAFATWRESAHKYQRRAVPVAMLGLLKTGKSKCKPLLAFIEPLMLDQERVVHQGLGWFLREAWKKEPEPVEAFLFRWKNRAARLIFQYATEKMPKEARARFARSRKPSS
jgi:3-methyladenine DNA glycosylase AlkD